MLTNSHVTVFCYKKETDSYVNCGSFRAWVIRKRKVKRGDASLYQNDTFEIRIPIDGVPEISPGDIICFGKTDAAAPDMSKCRRIAAVSVNRFGTRPHVHLEAEYDYR